MPYQILDPRGIIIDVNPAWLKILGYEKTERKNELLLKELNDRVKNNLMMVSSLIKLKNAELGDAADISDLVGRIEAIRFIHQNLEQNNSISSVNLKSYIEQLVNSAFSTVISNETEIKTEINDIQYPTRKVVILGLIINELATNAIKYGFSKGEKAGFSVIQKQTGKSEFLAFEVSNSGNEFPDDIDFENSSGFGLKLIRSLIKQLGGSIELFKTPQTTFLITIPV
jgi:two-component sensor histidine kinase